MSYPTLEQYNNAMQHPKLVLMDSELKNGTIATNGLGLPRTISGGFALTYAITSGSAKYAVRCFHKQSNNLEKRYRAISKRLESLHSAYFVKFEFQPQGVKVDGQKFPVVKMAWASGKTFGEFMGANYQNNRYLQELNKSILSLATYLEKQRIAHGDIQPGNVMVANEGKIVQLIDYDGMFVDDLKSLGGTELGLRNFQHPERTGTSWDSQLDRFSFILLNFAIRVLEVYPDLWDKTQSDETAILFRAQDFADPGNSVIFQKLVNDPRFKEDARNFAAICKSPFDKVPIPEDFLTKRNIPQIAIAISSAGKIVRTEYMGAYPVVDAINYELCLQHVGDRVELIGQVVEVKQDTTRYGTPYVFLNFDHWKGKISKIIIWSEALSTFPKKPDESWVGKWISIVGLMEPPYQTARYSHLSVTLAQANQLHEITESEAKYRLNKTQINPSSPQPIIRNSEILKDIRGVNQPTPKPLPISRPPAKSQSPAHTKSQPSSHRTVSGSPKPVPTTPNQSVLMSMKSGQAVSSTSSTRSKTSQTQPKQVQQKPVKQIGQQSFAWLVYIGIGLVAIYFFFNSNLSPSSTHIQSTPTQKLLLTATVLKPTQNVPNVLTPKESSCIPWTEINKGFEGDIKCIYGNVNSKRNFMNEDGVFSYTLIRFSTDPNSFYLTSHNKPLSVLIGDCVSAESIISYDANGVPFMETSMITRNKDSCSK
jgi:serine/threonine protein kinase